jgi:hypothetical protein
MACCSSVQWNSCLGNRSKYDTCTYKRFAQNGRFYDLPEYGPALLGHPVLPSPGKEHHSSRLQLYRLRYRGSGNPDDIIYNSAAKKTSNLISRGVIISGLLANGNKSVRLVLKIRISQSSPYNGAVKLSPFALYSLSAGALSCLEKSASTSKKPNRISHCRNSRVINNGCSSLLYGYASCCA